MFLLPLQSQVVCLTVYAFFESITWLGNGYKIWQMCFLNWQFVGFSHADGWQGGFACLLPHVIYYSETGNYLNNDTIYFL